MRVDLAAASITIGVIGAAIYAAIRGVRHRSFDVGSTILIFLALFSCPSGIALIRAGILGDPTALPSSWREHVAVAGIATIGLSFHYVVTSFKASYQRAVALDLDPVDDAEQSSTDRQDAT
jgi:hypothetical protein